jgi:hypothetical protein
VSSHTIPVWETASTPFVGIGHPSKKIPSCPKSFLSLPWLPSNTKTVWKTCCCGHICQSLEARVTPVETHTAMVVNICNTRHRIPVRSPENSKQYFALLIARVQMLFTFLSVLFVASNTLASLSSPSTNAWMDTGVTLQKAISSCEPALQSVWSQSRGFQQNENPNHWTELSVEWFSTWESGKILD